MRQFWMIYGEDCGAPTFRHLDIISAKAEAARLAHANPGKRFFVMAAQSFCLVQQPVQWTDLDDDIPF